jgi:GMP synthase (glutamine-hydrolysing)
MKQVLAVQQTWDDPPGYLGELLQLHGITCKTIQAEHEALPHGLNGYNALIMLGGPQHANDDESYPYLVREKALIRQAIEQDIPYLGICLGGQLLANVLGAEVRRHNLVEIGFYEVVLTEEGRQDPLFQGLPGYQQVIHWHEDVFDLPQGAHLLATSRETPHQAFRFGHRAYGLQYHIELTPAMFDTWLYTPGYSEEIIKILGPGSLEQLEAARQARYPVYREHTRIVFENFLRIAGLLSG